MIAHAHVIVLDGVVESCPPQPGVSIVDELFVQETIQASESEHISEQIQNLDQDVSQDASSVVAVRVGLLTNEILKKITPRRFHLISVKQL